MAHGTQMPKSGQGKIQAEGEGDETGMGPSGYTALEISRLVLQGRLHGLPKDRSAIHKLAMAEGWEFTVATKRGGPAKFFQVPDKYLEDIDNLSLGDRIIETNPSNAPPPPPFPRPPKATSQVVPKAPSKRTQSMTDEARKIGLQAVALIDDRIPALRRLYGDERYERIYLAVHRLIEKGVDQSSIGEMIKEIIHFDLIERH